MDNSPKELHINPAFEEDDKPTSMESVQLKAFPIQTEGESGHSNDGHCNQNEALNFEKAKPVQRSNRARLALVIIVCLIFLVALLLTLLMLVGKTGSSNEDRNDCASHPCKNNGICTDRVNGFNCSCAPGFYGPQCETDVPASSCKELYDKHKLRINKAYVLHTDSGKIPVYCYMTSYGIGACGRGGWTLVMKTDGHKSTFHYNSPLWTNKNEFNLPGGETGFDFQETKLPTYWNSPFSKICLCMKIGHQIKFIVINRHANSLYSLIADGKYRATSLGRNTWKTLIGSQASLQTNCNKEGFNVMCSEESASRARIGILGNEQNACTSCDSRIGFGTGGYTDDSNTCGTQATHSPDNGNIHIKAMGYILVQ